jgi:hypothetical protein
MDKLTGLLRPVRGPPQTLLKLLLVPAYLYFPYLLIKLKKQKGQN